MQHPLPAPVQTAFGRACAAAGYPQIAALFPYRDPRSGRLRTPDTSSVGRWAAGETPPPYHVVATVAKQLQGPAFAPHVQEQGRILALTIAADAGAELPSPKAPVEAKGKTYCERAAGAVNLAARRSSLAAAIEADGAVDARDLQDLAEKRRVLAAQQSEAEAELIRVDRQIAAIVADRAVITTARRTVAAPASEFDFVGGRRKEERR
jgi:hypothetical protein